MISGTWTAWDEQPGCCPRCHRPYDTTTGDGWNWPTFQHVVVAEKPRQDFVVVAWGILGPVPVPNPNPPEGRYISPERTPEERSVMAPLPAASSRPDGGWP